MTARTYRFPPSRLQTQHHVDFRAQERGTLHELLRGIHKAVYRGRDDIVGALAQAAARLCRETSEQ